MKMTERMFNIFSLFLPLLFVLVPNFLAFSEDIEPTKMKVAYAPIYSYNWPLWVAETKGFFKDENLTLELAKIDTFPKTAEDLSVNAIDIAFGVTPNSLIPHQLKEEPISIIGGVFEKPIYDLVVLPKYGIQDLKGTTLGIPSFDPGSTALLQEIMSVNKLNYPYDYGYRSLEVSEPGFEYTALQEKGFSGALVPWPTSFMAEDRGMVRLANIATYLPEYQSSVIAVNTDWAARHQETTVKFMKAIIRAQSWLHDLENKEEAIKILTKHAKIEEKYASMFYDSISMYPFAMPKDASVNFKGMQQVIALEQTAGRIQEQYPASLFVDVSYQERANIDFKLFGLQESIEKILRTLQDLEKRMQQVEKKLGISEEAK